MQSSSGSRSDLSPESVISTMLPIKTSPSISVIFIRSASAKLHKLIKIITSYWHNVRALFPVVYSYFRSLMILTVSKISSDDKMTVYILHRPFTFSITSNYSCTGSGPYDFLCFFFIYKQNTLRIPAFFQTDLFIFLKLFCSFYML